MNGEVVSPSKKPTRGLTSMRAVVALAVAAFSQAGAYAQALWRDVPAGATVEQVSKMLPGATSPEKPSVLGNGFRGLLEYRGFQVADVDFQAVFYFKEEKLDRVFLKPTEAQIGAKARSVAHLIQDSLTAKYGAPVSSNSHGPMSSMQGVSQTSVKWVNSGVQIQFEFNQYSESGEGFISVNYFGPQNAGNL